MGNNKQNINQFNKILEECEPFKIWYEEASKKYQEDERYREMIDKWNSLDSTPIFISKENKSNFIGNSELHNKAFILVLYYSVQTEEFDKTLMYTHPSPNDIDTVIPFGRSLAHSLDNAKNTRKLIADIALLHGITDEIMRHEKSKLSRMNYSSIKREFNVIHEYSGTQFIFDYIKEMSKIPNFHKYDTIFGF